MCGGGSVPLEAALAFPGCLFIGADLHPKALERCIENMVSYPFLRILADSAGLKGTVV